MVDVNLFSSKTDIKKLLFTTEKFHLNDHLSNDSWQDLSELTHPQEPDYSTIEKVETKPHSPEDYSRLDHWLLLSSTAHCSSPNDKIVTYHNNKRLSTTSLHPPTEQTFPDSCESLTVSVDLHVPTDELIIDHEHIDDDNIVVWRKILQDYRNQIPSRDTLTSSRLD